jgi:hypothetical protein
VRFFIAHGLAYPIACAWAFGAIPAYVIHIASQVGTSLDDEEVAHRVLVGLMVPTIAAFVIPHVAGVLWGLALDEERARRRFILAMALLGGLPVLFGGVSWIWLMTR